MQDGKYVKNNYSAAKEPKRKIIKWNFYNELFFF